MTNSTPILFAVYLAEIISFKLKKRMHLKIIKISVLLFKKK